MVQGAAFRILACFYDADSRNFVELCEQAGYPTDLGGYYIRQLVHGGYLEKAERGQYVITPKGKQQMALYYGKHLSAQHPRLVAMVVAKQQEKFVVLRRTVQPFIGVAEWPAGSVILGESIQVAAKRTARARLGAEVQPEFVGFFRRTDMYKETVFDDKLFAVHSVTIPDTASLAVTSNVGENLFCSEEDLRDLERPAKSLLDIFAFVSVGGGTLAERVYHLSQDDLMKTVS